VALVFAFGLRFERLGWRLV